MTTESKTEPTLETTTNEPPWREKVLKLLGNTTEARPVITCECALWGSPSPHSLWSEKHATAVI